MAAQSTAIADIYEPAIWADYFQEETVYKNKFLQAGILQSTPEVQIAASKGGRTVNMPFWQEVPVANEPEVATDTDDDATAYGLTTAKDIAVKQMRTHVDEMSPLVTYVAGSDPVQAAMRGTVAYWDYWMQQILLYTLTGIFEDATVASALENDISIADPGTSPDPQYKISVEAIEDTRFLLGDAYDKFTAMITHSTVFKTLRLNNLIDFIPDSQQNLNIPVYNGLRVFVDDTITKDAGTSGYKYKTYLFGEGAFAYADCPLDQQALEMYWDPVAGKGAGCWKMITRKHFIMHPRGVAWGGSITTGNYGPTSAQLYADNWTQVYQTKNIRIARLISNG